MKSPPPPVCSVVSWHEVGAPRRPGLKAGRRQTSTRRYCHCQAQTRSGERIHYTWSWWLSTLENCYCVSILSQWPTLFSFVSNICLSMQEIDVRLLCVKGIGQDHAKFSPVGKSLYYNCLGLVYSNVITPGARGRPRVYRIAGIFRGYKFSRKCL